MNKFSLYVGGIKNINPNREIDIKEFCNIISDENNKNKIDKIRKESDKDKKRILKSELDYVTFTGTFYKRNDKDLKYISGLASLDFDDLQNADLTKEVILSKDSYVHLAFISPSGNGVKVIIKIPKAIKNKDEYNEIAKNAYIYFENKYGLKGDIATHDLSRACFISFDDNYYFNDKSKIFDKLNLTIKNKPKKEITPTTEEKVRKDIFFTQLLDKQDLSISELSKADGRNIIFLKNAAAFSYWSEATQKIIREFIDKWDSNRLNKYEEWITSCKNHKYKVNYYELLHWAKEYNLIFFKELLEKQVKAFKKDYSSEEYEKALEIVKNNPLRYCLETINKRHIGEELIILLLIFSGISVGFRNRKYLLHIMGVGSSGKGKTDSMESVGKIFTGMYTITSASPKSIFYQSKDNKLPNQGILFYPENDNKEDFEALERVLTDDKEEVPSHNTVINGESVELSIHQKNVFWRNSVGTSNDEDNQTNNRYYIYNVDESDKQDEMIFNHILNSWNYDPIQDNTDLNICKAITDIIKSEPKQVYIPYIRYISLTRKEDRRILKKFLKLLNAVTYFNRFQRINLDDIVVSDVEDFYIANEIWKKINKYESSKLSEVESVLVELLASNHKGTTASDLSKRINKDVSNIAKKLKDMEEKGIVYSEKTSQTHTDNETGIRHTINPRLYFASKWYSYDFDLVVPTTISADSIKSDILRLNSTFEKCENSGNGTFGTKWEGVEKKIAKNIEKKITPPLSSKLLPNHIFNNINNKYIHNTDSVNDESDLVVPNTKSIPNGTKSKMNENIDKNSIMEDLK